MGDPLDVYQISMQLSLLGRCVSVGLARRSQHRDKGRDRKVTSYKEMYRMSPKGPVNCEFLCYQFDGVLVLDLAARIWPFPPPPHFCCFLFIFLQSNKDAEIWRIPMGAELFRQSIVL